MAKITLFNPPGPSGKSFTREGRCTQEAGVWATLWPPISLATAAALLEKDGHAIRVIDFPAAGLKLDALNEIISNDKPDFAVWNTGTPTLQFDLSLARMIKQAAPGIITAVMGTHVSIHPKEILNTPHLDVVIRREPEQTIRNLCLCQDRKWEAVSGISYRDRQSNQILHNPDSDFLPPAEIPSPAWHYLDLRPYRLPLKGRPFLIVAPIRGCPFPCSFCTAPVYYGKRLRKRPVDHVVTEIEGCIAAYKIKDFFVWADTFTADREYAKLFCREIIGRGINISWTCNSRVDTVDREMLALMKKAGLWMISFGLESGSETVLKRSGKNITVKQSKAAVTLAHELGIKTSGHFIFGLPGETRKRMKKTLKFSLDLPLDIVQFYTASPFPGTVLYKEALENGWLKTDAGFSQSRAVMDLPGLTSREVDSFRQYAYRKFYFRPQALSRLLAMLEPAAAGNIFMNLKGFFQWIKG